MHSEVNGLKTAALFGALGAVCIGLGFVFFGTTGMVVGFVIALAVNALSYFNADKIALRAMNAQPASEAQYRQLYAIVRELSTAAHQPMPRLYVSAAGQANAFATGRSPRHAALCCTEPILRLLDTRELRAVLGHELSHVYNRDILTSSVAGAFATGITFTAQSAMFLRGNRNRDLNPLAGLLMLILAPLAASIIQLAISRTREFQADRSGAELTGDPLSLATALRKIDAGIAAGPLAPAPSLQATSHLMIANPLRTRNIFSTHPPMAQRIARLQEMANDDPRFWR